MPGGTGLTALNNVTVRDNDFQQVSASRIVRHAGPSRRPRRPGRGNRYADANAAASGWFELPGVGTSLDAWRAKVEPTAQYAAAAYANPERTIASYNASLGGEASLDGFLAGARQQRQGDFQPAYSSAAAINYVRRGFAEGGVVPGGEVALPGARPRS